MRLLTLILIGSLVPGFAMAQDEEKQELSREVEVLYKRVEEQPPTVVEASPLEESKASRIRKNRIEAEKSTEDKLVEKLEKDRISAEQERARRAEKMFDASNDDKDERNNKDEDEDKNKDKVIVVEEPAPSVYQAPVSVVAPAPIEQTIMAQEKKEEVAPQEDPTHYYIMGLGGVSDYTSAKNVKGLYAVGVAGGMEFPGRFIVETSFVYSLYDVEESGLDQYYVYFPTTVRMEQKNISLTGKYAILGGRVRPMIGAIFSYTMRSFENRYPQYYTSSRPASWAIDGGLLGGVDVQLSKNFSIGGDFRYFMNLSYSRDEDPRRYGYYGVYDTGRAGKPIEEMSYMVLGVNAAVRF